MLLHIFVDCLECADWCCLLINHVIYSFLQAYMHTTYNCCMCLFSVVWNVCNFMLSIVIASHHLYSNDTQLFFSFHPPTLILASLNTLNTSLHRWLPICWLLTSVKQNLSSLVADNNLLKYKTLLLIPLTLLAINFIFDEHLTLYDLISTLSKSCYSHIRQLSYTGICPYVDVKIASTVATSTVHSKLDCCNSI